MSKRRKDQRQKDLTSEYLSGGMDEDRTEAGERFTARSKSAEQNKILRTAALRVDEQSDVDVETLPLGLVVQVFSLYSEVQHEGKTYLCVVRKTLSRVSKTAIVVGDQVRFRIAASPEEIAAAAGRSTQALPKGGPEGVIEQVLPRRTILTRTESYKGVNQHPIVANADQMLIVASLRSPRVKWGLVDRMIVAAQSGGLVPIVCLNKVDLAEARMHPRDADDGDDQAEAGGDDLIFAREALAHYGTLGIASIEASAELSVGLDALRQVLTGKSTVLAGHSGVGKSSLIRSIQSSLDLRVGEVSHFTDKGRHTTTSARRYPLDFGGDVIDTPGVKVFGLWGVSRDNLAQYFPDVEAGSAPAWRRQSYERIAATLAE